MKTPMVSWGKNSEMFATMVKNLPGYCELDKDDDRIAIVTRSLVGSCTTPSKKNPYLRASFGWFQDMFRDPDKALGNLTDSVAFAVILVKRENLPEKVLADLEKIEKEAKA